jgi:hypothetical protein
MLNWRDHHDMNWMSPGRSWLIFIHHCSYHNLGLTGFSLSIIRTWTKLMAYFDQRLQKSSRLLKSYECINNSVQLLKNSKGGNQLCSKHRIIATEHPVCGQEYRNVRRTPNYQRNANACQAIVEYYRLGMDTYQILTELPYITEAQLHDPCHIFTIIKKKSKSELRPIIA